MNKNLLKLAMVTLLSCTYGFVQAQSSVVTGTVTDAGGNPLVASVTVKNAPGIGTTTSETGAFTLTVPQTADSLVVSSVGYVRQAFAISGTVLNLQLTADGAFNLDEVVVIGYGTQRKGDLTAPVATVNMENAAKRTISTPMDALQGAVAGVQVVSSGAPGTTPTVRVRGVGSFNNENPLYVVDGMFMDNIDFLNPNDIADMSVLKDASGAAIYGVRAANGVIIVTTKKGSLNMKPRVTYNGYVGVQTPNNVLKMADGSQFAAYSLAKGENSVVESSVSKFGGTNASPAMSTDWYGELLRSGALITNHNLDVQGGSDKITYTFGINYLDQDGIMDAENYHRKYNIRMQAEARVASWLKIGFTGHLNNSNQFSPNNAAFRQAYFASPLYPVYDPSLELAKPVKFGTSSSLGIPTGFWFNNPIATAYYNHNESKGFQILPSAYLEANFWDNKLTFRSQLSQRYQSAHAIGYTPVYYIDNDQRSDRSYLRSAQTRNTNYILDNLLTYRDEAGSHHWTVLLGQSAREERWRETWVSANDVPESSEFWYVGQGAQGTGSATGYGEGGFRNAGISYFARGTYDYDSKYLLTATFRADGSSKYQTKWGYFPSLGLGWVLSREKFMENQSLFDLLKVRGSWGLLGNDGIQPNAGYAIVNSGNNYSAIFGSMGSTYGSRIPGYRVGRFFTQVRWEMVEEWDGGIDFALLDNRLSGAVDYYYRKTKDLAFDRPIPFMWDRVYGNWGSVANSGWEIGLDWKDQAGEFAYSIGVNATTLKNKVVDLGGLANIMNGFPEWSAEFPARIEEGQPINYYYGYEVAGVYQSQAEIDADPIARQYNEANPGSPILPGYLRYKDQNSNGELDEADRVNLGNYLPKLTYGLNIGLSYKQFDFSVALQGVAGNKIHNLNRAMRRKYPQMNMDQAFYEGLWTGEGSTNAYPSAQGSVASWNLQASSFFVESGAYLRVQNIQAGYRFNIQGAIPVRIFATADRPFIFTRYNGFTPEITGMGYDANVYPVSSTYSLGLNVSF
ncbi:SusC/RagA family TonB-linked outer membrane protein [Parapedobacter indicus]|uniref:TonB-linked outer membrane protein, SusC/RagA family n=1 Tax=Parapedobacter indicus TaxID=1477437 RepID=A0A1I3TYT0_9SPHI|nr:TonB-dependent receptor [Parapedobacter indicus]PPK99422.1 TonB-linked SusC/RagA family outer membrane protein [Parapedobacter indicus]SFJ74687.1 TonB-linked outer membrane protein, SusC/RagA family [Parapedobacter indicus]